MPASSPEEEAELLEQKEEWIRHVAERVCQTRGISSDIAFAGARWASLWRDDFDRECVEQNPGSREAMAELMKSTCSSSKDRLERFPDFSYSSGAPSLRLTMAACEAFCVSFGEEEGFVRELFGWLA